VLENQPLLLLLRLLCGASLRGPRSLSVASQALFVFIFFFRILRCERLFFYLFMLFTRVCVCVCRLNKKKNKKKIKTKGVQVGGAKTTFPRVPKNLTLNNTR
jgi:hypothetical protein